jgi:WD40 repeat protein
VSRRRTGDRQPETVWLVRADGSDLRDMLPGEKAIRSVSGIKFVEHWLNEETLIFADSCGTGCRRLVALDTRTGETQDFPLGGARYRWAPSGDKYVAIAGGGIPQTSLWERTDSGAWRETLLPRPSEFYAWSPDSQAFLFSHWPWEAGPGPPYAVTSHVPTLYVWDVAQGQAKELLSGAYQGAWSPDGERIAFFLLGEPVYDEELWLWGTDLVPGEPFALSLAIWDVPSGHVVAVIAFQEQMDVAEYVEVGLQSWFAVRQPVWSPDSQQLIYWGEGYDIWVVDRNGTEQRRLTHGLEVVEVVWSPDGSKLVFATAHRLYVVGRP